MGFGKSLIDLSEGKVWSKAIKEWNYTGNIEEDSNCQSSCELCGHSNIKYKFEIKNEINKNKLYVGSECINKFNVSAITEDGRKLTCSETEEKLKKDKRNFLKDKNVEYVLNLLIKIASKDEKFKKDSFFEYYKDRGAFTPRQTFLIVYMCQKYNLECNKKLLKVTIKRKREQDHLLNMEDYKLRLIFDCLSKSQKDKIIHKINVK
ncbi:hypothetical protein QJR28_09585 [Clostridium baratii]|uniref:hypothetical protein n=1 Tax=Clostridium baratii TaxID=1561 RepID=UPI0030CD3815